MTENNGKLIIGFNHERQWFGGFGDRVLGIINSKLIGDQGENFIPHITIARCKNNIEAQNIKAISKAT